MGLSQKTTPSTRSKRSKKVPPAVSKHGLYSVIVAQYANAKKNPVTTGGASASAASKSLEYSVIIVRADTETPLPSAARKTKQVRCGTCILFIQLFICKYVIIHLIVENSSSL